jgi:hypothetical protein
VAVNVISKTKKARISRSKFKATLIVLFDIPDIVMAEWVPSGQTVNEYYIEVLMKFRKNVSSMSQPATCCLCCYAKFPELSTWRFLPVTQPPIGYRSGEWSLIP